jgi:hypothetical protein
MLTRIPATKGRMAQALLAFSVLAGTVLIAAPPAAAAVNSEGADLVVASFRGMDLGNVDTEQAVYSLQIQNTVGHECIDPGVVKSCQTISVSAHGVLFRVQLPSGNSWSQVNIYNVQLKSSQGTTDGFTCTVTPTNLITCSGGQMPGGTDIWFQAETDRPRPPSEASTFNFTTKTYGTFTATAVVDPDRTIDERSYDNNSGSYTGLDGCGGAYGCFG